VRFVSSAERFHVRPQIPFAGVGPQPRRSRSTIARVTGQGADVDRRYAASYDVGPRPETRSQLFTFVVNPFICLFANSRPGLPNRQTSRPSQSIGPIAAIPVEPTVGRRESRTRHLEEIHSQGRPATPYREDEDDTPSGLPICQPMRFSIVPLASAVPFEPASKTARLVESGVFPSQKKKFVREAGIYCVGQATAFADRVVKVPKMGEMRGGELPDAPACSSQVARRRPSG
jgi:hypothetical protein